MTEETPVKKAPLRGKKQLKRSAKVGKLRPSLGTDAKLKAGDHSLDSLLKGQLDGRLKIKKDYDKLESGWIDYCGGPANLSPPVITLIQKICHKTLVTGQREKMALLGAVDLTDKGYLAMVNSLRLDILALQKLIGSSKGKTQSLEDYIEAKSSAGEK
jgi:hypothetical protein